MKVEVIKRVSLDLPEDESYVDYFEKNEDYKLVNSQINIKVFEKIKEITPTVSIENELKPREKLRKLIVEKANNMKEKALIKVLDKYKVPRDCYSILELKEDVYCIIYGDSGNYEVITYEKGKKYLVEEFPTFLTACCKLIKLLIPSDQCGSALAEFLDNTKYKVWAISWLK